MEESRLSRNDAVNFGGGLENEGGVTDLTRTRVDHNTAPTMPAASTPRRTAITQVKDSWVTDNTAATMRAVSETSEGFSMCSAPTFVDNTAAAAEAVSGTSAARRWSRTARSTRTPARLGGGIANVATCFTAESVLRDSEVNKNRAVGDDSHRRRHRQHRRRPPLSGLDSRSQVIENASTNPPGGIFNDNNEVMVDDDSTIIKNRPTNCAGQPGRGQFPNCFG